MKSLSKDQMKEKSSLVDAIRDAHGELETAVETYNKAMVDGKAKVQEKLDALNAKVQNACEWAEGIASDMQSYYDERSESWQEGDKGQAYDSWKSEYENLSAYDVEVDFPDDLEVPECSTADDLDSLPDES